MTPPAADYFFDSAITPAGRHSRRHFPRRRHAAFSATLPPPPLPLIDTLNISFISIFADFRADTPAASCRHYFRH
jgi:hypothetical protein